MGRASHVRSTLVALGLVRQSSPVAVAKKSKEPNLMLLRGGGAKVLTPACADELAIRVKKSLWHARGPLPSVPTVMILETGETIYLCSLGDASVDSLRMVDHVDLCGELRHMGYTGSG